MIMKSEESVKTKWLKENKAIRVKRKYEKAIPERIDR